MNKLVALVALVGVVCSVKGAGPSRAVGAFEVGDSCDIEGEFFADEDNICWYHQCVMNEFGGLSLMPRACALGTGLHYTFVQDFYNPCTETLNHPLAGFECGRQQQAQDVAPSCASDGSISCYNGGTLTYEADRCWCLCGPEWLGNHDCSLPTQYDAIVIVDPEAICADGLPDEDHCYEAGDCLNGGICHNLCQGYWCDCPDRHLYDYFGPRCEMSRDDYKK